MKKDEKRNLLVCPACGSEHMIKENVGSLISPTREDVHSCPRCMRNDQVMKITSIIGSQLQQTNGTTQVSAVESDYRGRVYSTMHTVPIQATQTSRLAQQLRIPDPPINPYTSQEFKFQNVILAWITAFLVSLLFFALVGWPPISWRLAMLGTTVVIIVVSVMRYFRIKSSNKKFQEYENILRQSILPRWERAQAARSHV